MAFNQCRPKMWRYQSGNLFFLNPGCFYYRSFKTRIGRHLKNNVILKSITLLSIGIYGNYQGFYPVMNLIFWGWETHSLILSAFFLMLRSTCFHFHCQLFHTILFLKNPWWLIFRNVTVQTYISITWDKWKNFNEKCR